MYPNMGYMQAAPGQYMMMNRQSNYYMGPSLGMSGASAFYAPSHQHKREGPPMEDTDSYQKKRQKRDGGNNDGNSDDDDEEEDDDEIDPDEALFRQKSQAVKTEEIKHEH